MNPVQGIPMNNIRLNRRHVKQTFAPFFLALGAAIWAIDLLGQLVL
tara:strand:- start:260 stop:397 length:138 start_codon:yes stop_codon:yes gene_type:complete